MKMLIANLMALGVLGAATAATAQELTPAQREARTHEAHPAGGMTPAQRDVQRNGMTPAQHGGPQPGNAYRPVHPAEHQELLRRRGDIQARQAADIRARQGAIQRRNFGNYQRNVQATRRFRAGFYRPPPGYAYRRWGWGQRLPGIYFAQNYWLTNWVTFGLFAPPEGLVWVRYGPDALLVDRFSGEIVQVRYGVFY